MSVERVKIYSSSDRLKNNQLICTKCQVVGQVELYSGYFIYPNRRNVEVVSYICNLKWQNERTIQVIEGNVLCKCRSIDHAHELSFSHVKDIPDITVCSHLTRLSLQGIEGYMHMHLPVSLLHLKLSCVRLCRFFGNFQLESLNEHNLWDVTFDDTKTNFANLKLYRAVRQQHEQDLDFMPHLEYLFLELQGKVLGTNIPPKLKCLKLYDKSFPFEKVAKYVEESTSLEKLVLVQWEKLLESCSASRSLKKLGLWECKDGKSFNEYSIMERLEAFETDAKDVSSLRRLFEKNNCIRKLSLPNATLDATEPMIENFFRRRGTELKKLDVSRLKGDVCIKPSPSFRTKAQVLKEAQRQRNASLVILIGKAFMTKDVSIQIAKEIKNFWE